VLSAASTHDAPWRAGTEFVAACMVRPWPGNVRELLAEVKTAVLAARSSGRSVLTVADLDAAAAARPGTRVSRGGPARLVKPNHSAVFLPLARYRPLIALVVALAAAVPLARARDAAAFCRTTTVHVPIGYNPVASGCWAEGAPIAWAGGQRIPYSLSSAASSQVSLADAGRVAAIAFSQWNNAPCANGQINVQAYDNGPVSPEQAANDCGLVQCDSTVHDSLHVIVFDDDGWPHNDPNNTLALTTVTYGVDSGTIYDADTEINTAQHSISAQNPPPAGSYGLQAILTHEAGHFFGLAHATSSVPIMYAFYQPTAVTLTQDDVDGICSIYPRVTKTGCACEAGPGGAGGWAFGACAGIGVVAALRRRRRQVKLTRKTERRRSLA
jgi:hypothetical protein